jgi:phosphoglycolate phosphatase-like HAD superfamily hydrolase
VIDLSSYHSLVFDCDGVLLDSNRIKTEAFRNVANQFGNKASELLVDFHVKNGGISRYYKFEYLFVEILGREIVKTEIDELVSQFAVYVYKELLKCPLAEGLKELREATKSTKWLIVSGGDQNELRREFSERGLSKYFDGGIFGSPTDKDEILANEIKNEDIIHPSLFLGDSRYDYEVADRAGLDFVFIYDWTDLNDWEDFCKKNGLQAIKSVGAILND